MNVMPLDVAVASEWLVTLTEDVADLDATADALGALHGFAVSARLGAVRSFVATMPRATMSRVRRDPSVMRVLHNRRLRAAA